MPATEKGGVENPLKASNDARARAFADGKCKPLAALAVSAGVNAFACVAAGGLCSPGVASFALKAFNAHAQCQLPPAPAAP